MKHSVLFVCTANICRSPLAMGLLQNRVGLDHLDWKIESAGTWATEGEPAAVYTIQVLRERQVDISGHRSRAVNRQMMDEFQLILTMERGHKEALRIEFPHAAGRIFLLSEMENLVYDIQDPMGSPITGFRLVARDLEDILASGFGKISQLSGISPDDNSRLSN